MKTLLIMTILSLNFNKAHGSFRKEVWQTPMEVPNQLNRSANSLFVAEANTPHTVPGDPLFMVQGSTDFNAPALSARRELNWEMLSQLIEAESALYNNNNLDLALENYMDVAWQTRDADVMARAVQLADLSEDPGDKDKAAQLEQWPKDEVDLSIKASQTLVPFLMRAGNIDGSFAHFKLIIEMTPDSQADTLNYHRLKHPRAPLTKDPTMEIGFDFAINDVATDPLRGQDPLLGAGFSSVMNILSTFLFLKGDRETAVNIMIQLAGEYTENTEAQIALAEILTRAEKFNEALKALEPVALSAPENAQIATFRAQLHQQIKEDQKGLDILARFLEHTPDSKPIRMVYGLMLWNADQLDRAGQQFKKILDAPVETSTEIPNPVPTPGLHNYRSLSNYYLAQIAESQGHLNQAMNLYNKVSGDQPYWMDAQIRIAKIISKTEGLEAAQSYLDTLPTNFRGQLEIFFARIDLFMDSGKQDEAIKEYHDFLDFFYQQLPRQPSLLPGYMRILGKYSIFVEKIERVDMDLIEHHANRILSLDPNEATALNFLGYMLTEHSTRYEEAYNLIERALRLKPDDPYIIDSMGWVLYRLGKYEEALEHLKRAMSLLPDPVVAAHLGEVHWVLGEKDEARRVWNDALKLDEENREYLIKTMERLDPPTQSQP